MIQPWKTIETRPVGDFRIFSLRSDRVLSPRTGSEHEFYVIDCVDWVNVIAVSEDAHLILVEQYRHGSGTVELEIPGGMMDPGDASPVATAARELREETGYAGDQPRIIGRVFPNPAIMINVCHTVLIENCRLESAPAWDPGEDLRTLKLPVNEVFDHVAAGKIRHSLVVAALYHFALWRRPA